MIGMATFILFVAGIIIGHLVWPQVRIHTDTLTRDVCSVQKIQNCLDRGGTFTADKGWEPEDDTSNVMIIQSRGKCSYPPTVEQL